MSGVDYFGELDAAAATARAMDSQARTTGDPRLVVKRLSAVVSQPPDWYWFRWLAKGKFHLLGGYAGDGKSTLLAALAAAASKGEGWPDGTGAGRRLRTLFLLGEDAAADTLKPRLELHGADMDQIFVIETVLDENGRERFFNVAKHLDLLEAAIAELRIDWVVIDPITTVMPGTDRNAEGDTRDTLTPLVKLGDRLGATVTGVAHVGKSEGARRAAQKILGATAFHALARIVWMIAPDEDGRMVLGVVKSNLAVKPPSLAWTREEDGPIRWEGVAAEDVEDLLANTPASNPRADAEGFLREHLAGGSRPSVEVEDAAKARGISKATLRRAAEAIPVKKWKAAGFNGQWYWSLPDGQSTRADAPEPTAEGKLLTPRGLEVSKLSKFQPEKVLNGNGGEHLHATTPIFASSHENGAGHVMEVAQLAHPETLRGEQVTFGADREAVTAQAKQISTLSPDELAAYRQELAVAPANDPHVVTDRAALALFDAMHAAGATA